jgi:hypothetical protein
VKDSGNGENDAADHGFHWAEEQTEEDDGLKGDIGGEEVGDGGSDPYAERERHEKEGEQRGSLTAAAALGKEKPLEGSRASECRGHGRGDAQLDQQRDEQEGVRHTSNVSRRWVETSNEVVGTRMGLWHLRA